MSDRNCAAFLRVRPNDDSSTDLDPLDDMRVHPLAYALATTVARAATGQPASAQDDDNNDDDEDDAAQAAVDRALKDRSKIEALSLAVRLTHRTCRC